jgi:hypothetical protein
VIRSPDDAGTGSHNPHEELAILSLRESFVEPMCEAIEQTRIEQHIACERPRPLGASRMLRPSEKATRDDPGRWRAREP